MVYKNELCGVYSISAGSDCGLYGFPKDVGSEENKIETKLNMVKEGFLCQTYVWNGDVVSRERSRLLHGSAPLDVNSKDTIIKLAGVLLVEYAEKVGKREEERRTRAKEKVEKVVKKSAERNDVRMLKMRDVAGQKTYSIYEKKSWEVARI